MAIEFHPEDVPPQQWLDQLQAFNIPRAWDINLTSTQRENLVAQSSDQLKQWRIGLKDQIKTIEKRYPKERQKAMEQMTAPYHQLVKLGTDLSNQLRDLEQRIQANRAIPMGFEFGTHIFGDMKTKRWFFGTQQDEYRWRDFLSVEQRYRTLTKEYKNQSNAYDNAKQRVDEGKQDLANFHSELKTRSGFTQIGIWLLIVMTVVLLCLAIGISALFVDISGGNLPSNVIAAVMLVLAIIGAIVAYQLARLRRFAIAQLEQDIAETETMLEQLTQEAKRQRQYILPTRQTLKEVKAEYDGLKATFG